LADKFVEELNRGSSVLSIPNAWESLCVT